MQVEGLREGSIRRHRQCNLSETPGLCLKGGVIQFMGLLEERFGIRFEDADLESPEFRTLGGLVRMVRRKCGEKINDGR